MTTIELLAREHRFVVNALRRYMQHPGTATGQTAHASYETHEERFEAALLQLERDAQPLYSLAPGRCIMRRDTPIAALHSAGFTTTPDQLDDLERLAQTIVDLLNKEARTNHR